jgi:hypothetical protein
VLFAPGGRIYFAISFLALVGIAAALVVRREDLAGHVGVVFYFALIAGIWSETRARRAALRDSRE